MAGIINYLTFYIVTFPAGVVDFIELDGDLHGEYHKIQKDENRDNYLANLGFIVLRFENRIVLQYPEYIKSEIRKVFNRKQEVI